ncbi:MAG: hypothetical protein AAFR81_28450 [Chloroflexota bacterium]
MQDLIERVRKDDKTSIFSDILVYDKLIDVLAYLSGLWRETKEDKVAEQYQTVLRALIIIGFDEPLDAEVELPDQLMPAEYLDMFSE